MEYTTIPNVLLNDFDHEKFRCFSGDWELFSNLCKDSFDYILTSETIYNVKNYRKLLDVFRKCSKKDSIVYPFTFCFFGFSHKKFLDLQKSFVAAKSYYFGVGGGVQEFQKEVEKQGDFNVSTVWKCEEGIKRQILKMTVSN